MGNANNLRKVVGIVKIVIYEHKDTNKLLIEFIQVKVVLPFFIR